MSFFSTMFNKECFLGCKSVLPVGKYRNDDMGAAVPPIVKKNEFYGAQTFALVLK